MGNYINFIIPGVAIPKARARVTRTGHAYTPAKTQHFEKYVKECFNNWCNDCRPFEHAIIVNLTFYVQIPKSFNKIKRQAIKEKKLYPTSRPDLDNLIKSILDALNELAYLDDSQIYKISAIKEYSEVPRVIVRIEE